MMDYWKDKHGLRTGIIPIFNIALERELSGYRIINGIVTPITNEVEIAEIEQALDQNDATQPVCVFR